ncbi:MAG: molybdate ABC transporter substrate-binding protein, partial [Actinomycetota bacterium]
MRRGPSLLVLLVIGGAVPACSSSASGDESELNVHVAASLSGVFTALGEKFEAQFPDVTLKFNFAGSSTLATQIEQGAPADVVVMADSANIEKLVQSGDVRASDVTDLAYNELAILVEQGNPLAIDSLDDLARPGVRVVLCDDAQPCGRYAATVLSAAQVVVQPASREANASAVVSRISNGEADAGIAYLTDGLVPNDNVDAVRIPKSLNITT